MEGFFTQCTEGDEQSLMHPLVMIAHGRATMRSFRCQDLVNAYVPLVSATSFAGEPGVFTLQLYMRYFWLASLSDELRSCRALISSRSTPRCFLRRQRPTPKRQSAWFDAPTMSLFYGAPSSQTRNQRATPSGFLHHWKSFMHPR